MSWSEEALPLTSSHSSRIASSFAAASRTRAWRQHARKRPSDRNQPTTIKRSGCFSLPVSCPMCVSSQPACFQASSGALRAPTRHGHQRAPPGDPLTISRWGPSLDSWRYSALKRAKMAAHTPILTRVSALLCKDRKQTGHMAPIKKSDPHLRPPAQRHAPCSRPAAAPLLWERERREGRAARPWPGQAARVPPRPRRTSPEVGMPHEPPAHHSDSRPQKRLNACPPCFFNPCLCNNPVCDAQSIQSAGWGHVRQAPTLPRRRPAACSSGPPPAETIAPPARGLPRYAKKDRYRKGLRPRGALSRRPAIVLATRQPGMHRMQKKCEVGSRLRCMHFLQRLVSESIPSEKRNMTRGRLQSA